MIVIGLTGSIGMGKSTTAALFAEEGVPVFDADAAVASLYARGGAGVGPVGEAFDGVVIDGAVSREALSAHLKANPKDFAKLEAIVHPLVGAARHGFIEEARKRGEPFVVFDIPLLFETGQHERVDVIVVVSAPEDVQRSRVLARDGMNEDKLDMILARQTPDHEKRARAHFVVDTSRGVEHARETVREILAALRERAQNPAP